MIMSVQLDDLKNSLRIDSSADDNMLNAYLITADMYIRNAVNSDLPTDFWDRNSVAPLLYTSTLALASGYYLARTPLSQVQLYPVDLSVNSIVGQLRGLADTYEVQHGN